jgi:hypothetical protein
MWKPFKPKNSVWYRWHLNGAGAYLRKENNAWRIAFNTIPFYEKTDAFGGPFEEEPPKDLSDSLSEFHAWGKGDMISLQPRLGTQPYIFKLQEKVRIAPEQKVNFTLSLPPLLVFELAPETILAQAMPLTLCQTFFGPDTMNGELGHSFTASLEQKETPSILINCEVILINSAKTVFEPGSIAISPEALSIYIHQDKLFADTLEFEFQETDCRTKVIEIKHKGYRLIKEGVKSGMGETFVRRSADIIRNITGL